MSMSREEALNTIVDVINDIKATDDKILSVTEKLKIVLFNLQLERVHIKDKKNGIEPIAEELRRNIETIDSDIKQLINNNRSRIAEAISALKEV